MNTNKKTFLNRLFDKPLWFHFMVWFAFVYILFSILVLTFFKNEDIKISTFFIGSIGLSILFGGMAMLMVSGLKQSDRFFTTFGQLEIEAKDALTPHELLKVRQNLIDLYRQYPSYGQSQVNTLFTMIDTRLNYEFKDLKNK